MKKSVFLIGGFAEPRLPAKSLILNHYRVSAINQNMDQCRELAKIDSLKVYHGDGTKPFVLEDAEVHHADIVIALTPRDEDNLVICELCKKKFHVKKTVSLVSDPGKTEFFRQMGVDSVVCAIATITGIIEQRLKRHMIILRSDVFAQRIQPPKLGSSCHRDSEPGILQVCMDIQQVRPLGKEDRLMLWLLT